MNIAVVIPVYNVAPYLKRCVDSLLAQVHRDFSLILVDDGSTDGSGAMCDDFAAHDVRIRVLHQSNAGLSAARNAALDLLARENVATHVTFVDSDDWVAPTYLAELVRGLSFGADIAAVRCQRTDQESVAWPSDGSAEWQVVPPRLFWATPDNDHSSAWGKLYARALFDGIRYPVGKINEDEFTTYRLFFKAEKVAFSTSRLYAYYVRPDSIMNAAWTPKRLDRLQAWRDQIAFFGGLGHDELVRQSRQGLIGDLVEAVRNLKRADEPRRAEECRRELSEQLSAGHFPLHEFYLAHKTAHPVRTRLTGWWRKMHDRYSLIFETPYALTLYLLQMSESQIAQTRFYAGDQLAREIAERLPNAVRVPVRSFRRWYRLRLFCLWHNVSYLRWTKIFAQDHLMFASQLLCGSRYTYIEDAPGIYTICKSFKYEHEDDSTPWRRVVAWFKFGSVQYHYVGQNRQCINRWVTDENDLQAEVLRNRPYQLINLRALWDAASPEKRRLVAHILTGKSSIEEIDFCKKYKVILLSQPMMQDCGLSEEEMFGVYAPAVERYRAWGVIVKPHPRDKFPFSKYFPDVPLLDTKIPMQILSALGVHFDVAITICSTAVSAFGADTKVCWLGTNAHPKIFNALGVREPPAGCPNVERLAP